jgi:hypothetical protein
VFAAGVDDSSALLTAEEDRGCIRETYRIGGRDASILDVRRS